MTDSALWGAEPAQLLAVRPFQLHLGSLVHAAIGMSLQRAPIPGAVRTVESAELEAVWSADPLRRDTRRAKILLRSLVRSYLDSFMPPAPWQLDCAERRLRRGRVDLMFVNPRSGVVVVDEVKTGRHQGTFIEPATRLQVAGYLGQLRSEFGARFLGVRLVHLAPPARAYLFTSLEDLDIPLAKIQGLIT